MVSQVSFDGMENFYQKIDVIQRNSIQRLKVKAQLLSNDNNYEDEKANFLAKSLIKKGYKEFKEKSEEAFKDSDYASLLGGVFINRGKQFMSPYSPLIEEIRNILLQPVLLNK